MSGARDPEGILVVEICCVFSTAEFSVAERGREENRIRICEGEIFDVNSVQCSIRNRRHSSVFKDESAGVKLQLIDQNGLPEYD